MLNANQLKSGAIVEMSGQPCTVETVVKQTPSARGGATIYKVRARNLVTGTKVDGNFRGEDSLPVPNFSKEPVQYSYRDQTTCVFMNTETYEQYELPADSLTEELQYLREEMEDLTALVLDERVVGIVLPDTVELLVTECDPAIKGASATARTKPATLETGLVIQVPEYLQSEETVRVDTRTGKFLGRA